jgi:hypothetical protein
MEGVYNGGVPFLLIHSYNVECYTAKPWNACQDSKKQYVINRATLYFSMTLYSS